MAKLNLFGNANHNSVRVGYIHPTNGFVDGVSLCEANDYAQKNPGTTFIFKTRDIIRYLSINEVNNLTADNLATRSSAVLYWLDHPDKVLKESNKKIANKINKLKKTAISATGTNTERKIKSLSSTKGNISKLEEEYGSTFRITQSIRDAKRVVCGQIKFFNEKPEPLHLNFLGGGGVGAKANPIIGKDGSILAVDVEKGGFGYQYPPTVRVVDSCGFGAGFIAKANLGEIVPTLETYEKKSDFEEYNLCPDPGYGRRYGPNGEDIGPWDPRTKIQALSSREMLDPRRDEILKYQKHFESLKKPWWTTRRNPPTRVQHPNPVTSTKKYYEVDHWKWNRNGVPLVEKNVTPGVDLVEIEFEIESGQEKFDPTRHIRSNAAGQTINANSPNNWNRVSQLRYKFTEIKDDGTLGQHFIVKNEQVQDVGSKKITCTLKANTKYQVTSYVKRNQKKFSVSQGIIKFKNELYVKNKNGDIGIVYQQEYHANIHKFEDGTYGESSTVWGRINDADAYRNKWRSTVRDDIRITAKRGKFTAQNRISAQDRQLPENLKKQEDNLTALLEEAEQRYYNYRWPNISKEEIEKWKLGIGNPHDFNPNHYSSYKLYNQQLLDLKQRNVESKKPTFDLVYEFSYEKHIVDDIIDDEDVDSDKSFMNRYAISPVPKSNETGSDKANIQYSMEWEEDFPYTGDYKFRMQCDDFAHLYIDGTRIKDINKPDDEGRSNRIKKYDQGVSFKKVNVPEGRHTIRVDLKNKPVKKVITVSKDLNMDTAGKKKNDVRFFRKGKQVFLDTRSYTDSTELKIVFAMENARHNKDLYHRVMIHGVKETYDIFSSGRNSVKKEIELIGGGLYRISFETTGKTNSGKTAGRGSKAKMDTWRDSNQSDTDNARKLLIYHGSDPKASPSTPDEKNSPPWVNWCKVVIGDIKVISDEGEIGPKFEYGSDLSQFDDDHIFDTNNWMEASNRELWRVDPKAPAIGYKNKTHGDFYNEYGVSPENPWNTLNYQGFNKTPISTIFGDNTSVFGHADYWAARRSGWDDKEILEWMDKQMLKDDGGKSETRRGIKARNFSRDYAIPWFQRPGSQATHIAYANYWVDKADLSDVLQNKYDDLIEAQNDYQKTIDRFPEMGLYDEIKTGRMRQTKFVEKWHPNPSVAYIGGNKIVGPGGESLWGGNANVGDVSSWDPNGTIVIKKGSSVIDQYNGIYELSWNNIDFKKEGTYKIELIADDMAIVKISDSNNKNKPLQFSTNAEDNKKHIPLVIKKEMDPGKRKINIKLHQHHLDGEDISLAKGNPMGVAMKITYLGPKGTWENRRVNDPKSWYENPMGFSMTIDAPEPPQPPLDKKPKKEKCPKNPMWTTRQRSKTSSLGKKNQWWPVRFELTPEERARGQSGDWSDFHNRYAISPVPPKSEPGTDGSSSGWYEISWEVDIPYDGFYKLKVEADEMAKVSVTYPPKVNMNPQNSPVQGPELPDFSNINLNPQNSPVQGPENPFDTLISNTFKSKKEKVMDLSLNRDRYIGSGSKTGTRGGEEVKGGSSARGEKFLKLSKTRKNEPITITIEVKNKSKNTYKVIDKKIFSTSDWIDKSYQDRPTIISTPPEEKIPDPHTWFGYGNDFGHADYYHALQAGYTPTELLKWMEQNQDRIGSPGSSSKPILDQVRMYGVPRRAGEEERLLGQADKDGLWTGNFNTWDPTVQPYKIKRSNVGESRNVEIAPDNYIVSKTEAQAYFRKSGRGYKLVVDGNGEVKVTFKIKYNDSSDKNKIAIEKFSISGNDVKKSISLTRRRNLKGDFKKRGQDSRFGKFSINGEGPKQFPIEIKGNNGRTKLSGGKGTKYNKMVFTDRNNLNKAETATVTIVSVENLVSSYTVNIPTNVTDRDAIGRYNEVKDDIETTKGSVGYVGPPLVSYFDDTSRKGGKFISPYFKSGIKETVDNQDRSWAMKWSNVEFPKNGIYNISLEGDDIVELYIDGYKRAEVKESDGTKTFDIDISKGYREVGIVLTNNTFTQSSLSLKFNPVMAACHITMKEEIISKDSDNNNVEPSWMENPMGVSAVLIPPPCPKDIVGKGVITSVDVIEPGFDFPLGDGGGDSGIRTYPVRLRLKGFTHSPGPNWINYRAPDTNMPFSTGLGGPGGGSATIPGGPVPPSDLLPPSDPSPSPDPSPSDGDDDNGDDIVEIFPDFGAVVRPIYDEFGSIGDLDVIVPGDGVTEWPEIDIPTDTGIPGTPWIPIFEVERDPIGVPPEELIQVTDLVGIKQTGYIEGRPYYGSAYLDNGLLYAGKYATAGVPIQVFPTLQESITGVLKSRPDAIQRQGTDITNNDPRLNIPGTPENLV